MIYKNTFVLAAFSVLMAAALLVAAAISLPAAASAHSNGSSSTGTMVSINNEGSVLVRGATVTSVGADLIEARTVWGDTDISWDLQIDGDTDFFSKGGADSSSSAIETGDKVSFSGSLDQDGGAFTVIANVIRNWSIDDIRATLSGTIESVNDDNDTFVLETKHKGEVTVETDGDTDFLLRSNDDADFGDLTVGSHVSVTGAYDEEGDTLTAAKVMLGVKAIPFGNAWGFWKDFSAKFSGKFFGHDK